MSLQLTLELGIRQMRLTEARGHRPLRYLEVALPDDAIRDGMPTRIFKHALVTALKDWGSTAVTALVAISDAGTAVRDLRLPRLSARDLEAAVTYEARRIVPMDPGDLYYAWHAARDRTGYAVYLAAARRDMVDALVGAVASAGLTVGRIDLAALALARGAQIADGLILDWGIAEATLLLVAGGRPRFFRTFAVDAPDGDAGAQLEEIATSVQALIRFMRSGEPTMSLGPTTPLYLAGRFAVLPDGQERARQHFGFEVHERAARAGWPPALPWGSCLVAVGLLGTARHRARITPGQGGESRVAA